MSKYVFVYNKNKFVMDLDFILFNCILDSEWNEKARGFTIMIIILFFCE